MSDPDKAGKLKRAFTPSDFGHLISELDELRLLLKHIQKQILLRDITFGDYTIDPLQFLHKLRRGLINNFGFTGDEPAPKLLSLFTPEERYQVMGEMIKQMDAQGDGHVIPKHVRDEFGHE